jgi:hypothetical protein
MASRRRTGQRTADQQAERPYSGIRAEAATDLDDRPQTGEDVLRAWFATWRVHAVAASTNPTARLSTSGLR